MNRIKLFIQNYPVICREFVQSPGFINASPFIPPVLLALIIVVTIMMYRPNPYSPTQVVNRPNFIAAKDNRIQNTTINSNDSTVLFYSEDGTFSLEGTMKVVHYGTQSLGVASWDKLSQKQKNILRTVVLDCVFSGKPEELAKELKNNN